MGDDSEFLTTGSTTELLVQKSELSRWDGIEINKDGWDFQPKDRLYW